MDTKIKYYIINGELYNSHMRKMKLNNSSYIIIANGIKKRVKPNTISKICDIIEFDEIDANNESDVKFKVVLSDKPTTLVCDNSLSILVNEYGLKLDALNDLKVILWGASAYKCLKYDGLLNVNKSKTKAKSKPKTKAKPKKDKPHVNFAVVGGDVVFNQHLTQKPYWYKDGIVFKTLTNAKVPIQGGDKYTININGVAIRLTLMELITTYIKYIEISDEDIDAIKYKEMECKNSITSNKVKNIDKYYIDVKQDSSLIYTIDGFEYSETQLINMCALKIYKPVNYVIQLLPKLRWVLDFYNNFVDMEAYKKDTDVMYDTFEFLIECSIFRDERPHLLQVLRMLNNTVEDEVLDALLSDVKLLNQGK